MSLETRLAALADRVADEFNSVRSALSGKASSSHTHASADVNSGTLGIARIPTGTSSTTVSFGDHTHSYQAADSDLTTIAGLTATTDNFLQAKSSAWASRTPTQVAADLVTPLSSSLQPIDSDLTAIAGLSPSNDDVIQRKAGAWTNRTVAQLKTDLGVGTASTFTITYAGTISADRANGPNQKVTATGNITSLGVSATGAVDGEVITIRVLASGGARTVTPATGVIGAKTVPSTKVGFFQFMYDSDAAAYVHVGYGASG